MRYSLVLFVLILCGLNSCVKDKQNRKTEFIESSSKNAYEKIQGDWVAENYNNNTEHCALQVKDSNIFFLFHYYPYSKFIVSDSLLTVKDTSISITKKTFHYPILEWNKNEIKLLVMDSIIQEKIKYWNWTGTKSDTICLKKLTQKNNIIPIGIEFSSDGCFGCCPVYKCAINNNGEISFYGYHFTKYQGFHQGKISTLQWKQILDVIQYLDLKNLQEEYTSSVTDSSTDFLVIKTKEKEYKVKDYAASGPPELRVLFRELSSLLSSIHLNSVNNKADTIFDSFLGGGYMEEIEELPPGK